ncbi:MAG: MFS transporter [Bacillota bacterium]
MFNDIPRNVWVRLVANLVGTTIYMAVFPFLALLFSSIRGTAFTGSLLSVTVMLGYVVRLLGGYLADIYSRKRIVVYSNSISAIAMTLMALSFLVKTQSFALLLVGYLLHSVVTPISGPSMQALIIDSTTPKIRKRVYTITYWTMNIAASFGYAIGGYFYEKNHLLLFVLLAVSSLFTVLLYILFLQDSAVPRAKATYRNPFRDILNHYYIAVKDKQFVLTVLGYGMLIAGEDALAGFIGIRLSNSFKPITIAGQYLTGVRMLSLLMMENAILVALLSLFMSKATDRFSRRLVLIGSSSVYALGFVLLSASLDFWPLLLFGLINTIGETEAIPVIGAEQANMMPEDKRASYIALSSLSQREAKMIASSLIVLSGFVSPLVMSTALSLILFSGISVMARGFFADAAESGPFRQGVSRGED